MQLIISRPFKIGCCAVNKHCCIENPLYSAINSTALAKTEVYFTASLLPPFCHHEHVQPPWMGFRSKRGRQSRYTWRGTCSTSSNIHWQNASQDAKHIASDLESIVKVLGRLEGALRDPAGCNVFNAINCGVDFSSVVDELMAISSVSSC